MDLVFTIESNIRETTDDFIFTILSSYLSREEQIRISKKDLVRAVNLYYGDMNDMKDFASMVERKLIQVGQSDARFKLGETIRYAPNEVRDILLGTYKRKEFTE